MSDTPSPSLLSEERLAEIRARSEKSAGFAYQSEAMNDRADLLRYLAALRQQVATELAELSAELSFEREWSAAAKVDDIATRLSLNLAAPTP